MRRLVLISFTLLAVGHAAVAQDRGDTLRVITMRGWGVASQVPDRAVVRLRVQTESPAAQDAFEANAETAARVLDMLRALGIPEERIGTEGVHLDERRDLQDDVFFRAYRSTSVVIDEIERVPEIMVRALESGASSVGRLQYIVRDRRPLELEALEAAMVHARAKAEAAAQADGLVVGQVLGVSEQGTQPLVARGAFHGLGASGNRQAPPDDFDPGAYAPGEYKVHASVIVSFSLEAP